MDIVCRKFRPFARNTLLGFAEIEIKDIGLTVRDVALHQKGDSRWAQLPAKPQIKDGAVVSIDGKAQYVCILEFGSREARDKFSDSVISAALKTSEGQRAPGQGRPQDKPQFDDEINF
jgi:hypothetical protein